MHLICNQNGPYCLVVTSSAKVTAMVGVTGIHFNKIPLSLEKTQSLGEIVNQFA